MGNPVLRLSIRAHSLPPASCGQPVGNPVLRLSIRLPIRRGGAVGNRAIAVSTRWLAWSRQPICDISLQNKRLSTANLRLFSFVGFPAPTTTFSGKLWSTGRKLRIFSGPVGFTFANRVGGLE